MRRERTEPDVRSAGYIGLLHDLESDGCAVCRGASRSAWRTIDAILWEGVTDPYTRTHLRRSRGFCREHSFMAIRVADAENGQLGMAIVYEDLLAQVELHLRAEPAKDRRWRRETRSLPEREAACPACASARGSETTDLRLLGRAGATSELGRRARSSRGALCLPHLLLGLETADEREARSLIDIALASTGELRQDLQEFIRKRDHRFSHEPVSPAETDAWRRAVRFMVGDLLRRPPAYP